MEKWKHRDILIYFADTFDTGEENCLPYMPENLTCNIPGRNEEIDILHSGDEEYGKAGTFNLLKRPGLKTWSIECFFNHPEKPMYATVGRSEKWTPQAWVDFFESAMYMRKVLEMTITGLDVITYVTVENFKHTKEAGEELDTYYTIELKEYQFNEIKKEEINITQEMPPTNTGNTPVIPQQPNLGNITWLYGRAWKGFSPMQGLSSICCDKIFNKPLFFNYLKIKVLEKRINSINGLIINQKVKTEVDIAINKYTFGVQPTEINVCERLLTIFNSALNYLPEYKQYAENYSSCIRQYVKVVYGNTNVKMLFTNFRDTVKETMYDFLMSLLSSEDYLKVKSCLTNRGVIIDENIVKVRNEYVGSFIDAMAMSEIIGGEKIAQIEALEDYSYNGGTAGDLRRLEYQGIQSSKIVYTLNQGDKLWCLDKDLFLQNNGNVTFTLSYYSN